MKYTEYRAWLLRVGMTEESADKYVRGLESILRSLVERHLLGEYDEAADAVTLLAVLDGVEKDQKYYKKYIAYLCWGRWEGACLPGRAAQILLEAFYVRDRKAGFRSLLAAIHPNLPLFLSGADQKRLAEDAADDETCAQRRLLCLAMKEEGARHQLAALLYARAEEIYNNRTEAGFDSPLQALRTFTAQAARGWLARLPESERALPLSFLESACFDAFEERELALYVADGVLGVLLNAAGEADAAVREDTDLPLLQALSVVDRLTGGKGLPFQVLEDAHVRKLLTEGYLYLREQAGKPCLQVLQSQDKAPELSLLWQDEQAREWLCRLTTQLFRAAQPDVDLAMAVAMLAAAPRQASEQTEHTDLYTALLKLICRVSLSLRGSEDLPTRLEGCEHLKELFELCPYATLQALSALLPAQEQELLHRRDGYGNSLCYARLLEDIANCAMKLAEGEETNYYLTYAALCFGRANAVAEGCGDRDFALRAANGRRDALERRAHLLLKDGFVEQEYLYDHGLPITAAQERIAELKGEERVIDLRGMRAWRGSVICMKECPEYIGKSPTILKPRGIDLGGFFNEYYIASLDSEVACRKKHTDADAQSIIMMMLLQGQRVILSTNMLTDNARILELADEPAFLELMRRGYILLSFYGKYHTLIEFCADQLEGRFEWSSMPFLNYADTAEDSEIKEKRAAVSAYLRGKTPCPALADPSERKIIALFKERLERFEEALPLAGLCYYYQRSDAPIVGVLRPRLQRFYRQRLTDPDFAEVKQVHGMIDTTLSALLQEGKIRDYNRTSYKNCIDLIADGELDAFDVTGEQLQMLADITPQRLEQLRDVLSDQHNYVLSRRISNFYHNDYRELWRVPPKESGVSSYKNVRRFRVSGERVDWKQLLEVLTRMRALILERPTAERLAGQLSSGGQRYVIDPQNKLRVERAGLVLASGRQVELSLSEAEDATIHVETEREYER